MVQNNIFITGGHGKIGRFLLEELRIKDYDVCLLCREGYGSYHDPGIKCIKGDLLKPDSYSKMLEGRDNVVHMGGVTHTNYAAKYYEVNADATLRLIKMCESQGVRRFIFISTRAISAHGGHYSRSKLMAEQYVKESSLNWVILRLAEVYGTQGDTGINMILHNIHKFPFVPIIGNGKYKIAPVHVSDVIFSIMKVIERRDLKNKIYTIAGPESFTYSAFIDKVLALNRIKRFKIHIPLYLISRFLDVFALFAKDGCFAKDQIPRLLCEKSDNISLAVKDLCFKPIRLEEAIRKNK